jgi:hypothetical protein
MSPIRKLLLKFFLTSFASLIFVAGIEILWMPTPFIPTLTHLYCYVLIATILVCGYAAWHANDAFEDKTLRVLLVIFYSVVSSLLVMFVALGITVNIRGE